MPFLYIHALRRQIIWLYDTSWTSCVCYLADYNMLQARECCKPELGRKRFRKRCDVIGGVNMTS